MCVLTDESIGGLAPAIDERVTPPRHKAPTSEQTLLAYNLALKHAGEPMPRPEFGYQRHGLYGYAGAIWRGGSRFRSCWSTMSRKCRSAIIGARLCHRVTLLRQSSAAC